MRTCVALECFSTFVNDSCTTRRTNRPTASPGSPSHPAWVTTTRSPVEPKLSASWSSIAEMPPLVSGGDMARTQERMSCRASAASSEAAWTSLQAAPGSRSRMRPA